MRSETRNVTILDVRSDEEVAGGILPGAIAIPADEVVERLVELPLNKPIFVYCQSGIRAQMIYSLLKAKGYEVKYLYKSVLIEKDGSFSIQ